MLRVILFIHMLCSFAYAETIGFSRGSEFTATSIQGQVQVACNGFNGAGTATYTCREVALDPNPYDYFIGPKDYRVDKLELNVIQEGGIIRNKLASYDGVYGKSREAFNLWISTLFQKPLLAMGLNTIHYKLYSDNNSKVYDGSFEVTVKKGSARQCRPMQYTSTDINDCNSQYSMCQKYFNEQSNCR
ncbi:MAG: hypothetical protein ACXVCR_17750 [Bdellovibrio sp.]